ncbi:MAG: hypothetical protein ACKV2T_22245 [Kofleriaceae bacterium]
MSTVDTLGFVEAVRVGGPQHQERRYYDYTINGHPLRAMIDPGDNIGLFGWLPHEFEVEFARSLLLRGPSKLPSGRVPLYICPECGDLGCQSLSARVIEERDRFVWTEFAYEANYDAGPTTELFEVRPLSFEKRAYAATIGRFAT